MNKRMNLPNMQKILMEFEKQNERMEMTSDMMGDAIDDAMEVRGGEGGGRPAATDRHVWQHFFGMLCCVHPNSSKTDSLLLKVLLGQCTACSSGGVQLRSGRGAPAVHASSSSASETLVLSPCHRQPLGGTFVAMLMPVCFHCLPGRVRVRRRRQMISSVRCWTRLASPPPHR